ncbi:MAG: thermonuclease family protein [Candidatus Pacebacteria bacterium]|nr:thermonuclease family protein [Candidatus Paceibacterota bacterium]
MKKTTLSLIIVLIIIIFYSSWDNIDIVDGDTIKVGNEHIRLLGIDAPEKGDCFYTESSDILRETIGKRDVRLEINEINRDKDDYGRLLRYVYVDNELVNQKLLEVGAAKYLSYFPITKSESFKEAEIRARNKALGIWSACN